MAPAAPVKVVHLITLLEFGGAQGNTIHTVHQLDRERFDAQLWSGKGAYWDKNVETSLDLKGRLRFFNSLVRPLNPLCDLFALFSLSRALKKFQPTILHTHSSKAGIIGRIAAKVAGVPVVIHSYHGFGFNDRQKPWTRGLFIFLERLCARFTDVFIFVSMSNWKTAESLAIGDTSRYRLIRSGVPLAKIKAIAESADRSQVRRELGVPEGAKVITTIGAFKPQKNLFDFISAAEMILKQMPDAYFVILGDGSLRPALERRLIEKNLTDRVKLPGWREDAARFLASSDLFAMTSLWEGLPRALVEAMSIGLPSVCYDTDGVRDLLAPFGRCLVRQGDVAGLAETAVDLLREKAHYHRISDGMRAAIGPEFDIDGMVRAQETLYSERLK